MDNKLNLNACRQALTGVSESQVPAVKRVVRTPPPPRAELVQQQAEEEGRRRAAAAVKLAEIEQRIAHRKAEEAAVASEAAALLQAEAQCTPQGSAEQQVEAPIAPPLSAPLPEVAAAERHMPQPSSQLPAPALNAPAPNAWTKPLPLANGHGVVPPAIMESGEAAGEIIMPDSVSEGSPTDSAAAAAAAAAVVAESKGSERQQLVSLDCTKASGEGVSAHASASDGSLVPADAADSRGQRAPRGRGRARSERIPDGDSAADRYAFHLFVEALCRLGGLLLSGESGGLRAEGRGHGADCSFGCDQEV